MKETSEQKLFSNNISNFTSDFFNTLEDSLAGNSFDYSQDGLRSELSGKSQIFRQLKQETIYKLQEIVTKIIHRHVLDQIQIEGEKRRRREKRTPANIAKYLYKLELMLGLKIGKKVSHAFGRLAKFSNKYAMAGVKDPKEKRNIVFQTIINRNFFKVSVRIAFSNLQAHCEAIDKLNIFHHILSEFINKRVSIKDGMDALRRNSDTFSKKEFFISFLQVLATSKMRQHFTQIKNSKVFMNIKQKQQQNICSLEELLELNENSIHKDDGYYNINANDQEQKPTIKLINEKKQKIFQQEERKTVSKKSERMDSEIIMERRQQNKKFYRKNHVNSNGDSRLLPNQVTKKLNQKRTPLKFNKGLKRNSDVQTSRPKSKSKSKIQKKLVIDEKTTLVETNINNFFQVDQTGALKSVEENLLKVRDCSLYDGRRFALHLTTPKVQQLTPQPLQTQIPDMTALQIPIPLSRQISTSKVSQISAETPSMDYFQRSHKFFDINREDSERSISSSIASRRVHRLQKKESPQFGEGQKKLKFSQVKKSASMQKNFVHSSPLISYKQSGRRMETQPINNMNFSSLKHYYFPEQLKFQRGSRALLQRDSSSDMSSQQRWLSKEAKEKLNAVTVTGKHNPDYYQELREKYGKRPIDTVRSLNKFTDGAYSSRSNSKLSTESNKKKIDTMPYRSTRSPQPTLPYSSKNIAGRNLDYQGFSNVPRAWHLSPQANTNSDKKEVRFKFQSTRQRKKLPV